ncbi:unnamed protein product, partial [Ectocarpus sp. 12 AP-2014]
LPTLPFCGFEIADIYGLPHLQHRTTRAPPSPPADPFVRCDPLIPDGITADSNQRPQHHRHSHYRARLRHFARHQEAGWIFPASTGRGHHRAQVLDHQGRER